MPEFDDDLDRGLHQERTLLAWDRTALALMITAGLLARIVGIGLTSAGGVVAVVVFGFGLGLLVFGRGRYLSRRRLAEEGNAMTSTMVVSAVAGATALLGVAALLVVIGAVH